MWARFLGPQKDLSKLIQREWEGFIDARRSGAINARGNRVPDAERKPVRDRAVEYDLNWLKWVINWATRWRQHESESYLMRESPARGFETPEELNPRRPVATTDRFEMVRAVADEITMRAYVDGKRREVPSYLPEILDIAWGTGHRISSALGLRYEDLRLDENEHGVIRWPSTSDKQDKEWEVPLNQEVRAAINRILTDRPGIGAAYLFPSPRNPAKPVSKDLASDWLLKAERLAGVPKQDGTLWQAYRRGWATVRKHHPDLDVAYAGGWSALDTLKTAYQHADTITLSRVVSEPRRVQEVKS